MGTKIKPPPTPKNPCRKPTNKAMIIIGQMEEGAFSSSNFIFGGKFLIAVNIGVNFLFLLLSSC